MFNVKHIMKILKEQKLHMINIMQLIKGVIKSFQELNDKEKIDALVKNTASFAKKCNTTTFFLVIYM